MRRELEEMREEPKESDTFALLDPAPSLSFSFLAVLFSLCQGARAEGEAEKFDMNFERDVAIDLCLGSKFASHRTNSSQFFSLFVFAELEFDKFPADCFSAPFHLHKHTHTHIFDLLLGLDHLSSPSASTALVVTCATPVYCATPERGHYCNCAWALRPFIERWR